MFVFDGKLLMLGYLLILLGVSYHENCQACLGLSLFVWYQLCQTREVYLDSRHPVVPELVVSFTLHQSTISFE